MITSEARTRPFALAGYSRPLAISALAMGAVVVAGLLLDIAFLAGHLSGGAYHSALVQVVKAATPLLLGPLTAVAALAARDATLLERGRGVLMAAARVGLGGAAALVLFFLARVNLLGPIAYLAIAAAMALLAAGCLRARALPAYLVSLLFAAVVLMGAAIMDDYTLGTVLTEVASGALALFWVALGVYCMPRREAQSPEG